MCYLYPYTYFESTRCTRGNTIKEQVNTDTYLFTSLGVDFFNDNRTKVWEVLTHTPSVVVY